MGKRSTVKIKSVQLVEELVDQGRLAELKEGDDVVAALFVAVKKSESVADTLIIDAGFVLRHLDKEIIRMRTENTFLVEGLGKQLKIDDQGGMLFNNPNTLYFMVDNAIGHLRGIQAHRFPDHQSFLVPLNKAKKILVPKNLVESPTGFTNSA